MGGQITGPVLNNVLKQIVNLRGGLDLFSEDEFLTGETFDGFPVYGKRKRFVLQNMQYETNATFTIDSDIITCWVAMEETFWINGRYYFGCRIPIAWHDAVPLSTTFSGIAVSHIYDNINSIDVGVKRRSGTTVGIAVGIISVRYIKRMDEF